MENQRNRVSKMEDKLDAVPRKRLSKMEFPDFTALRELFRPHIESFDHMIDAGLQEMFRHIKPVVVVEPLTSTKLRNILLKLIKCQLINTKIHNFC